MTEPRDLHTAVRLHMTRTIAATRRAPTWRRRTVDEAERLFAELGLTGPFWRLRA